MLGGLVTAYWPLPRLLRAIWKRLWIRTRFLGLWLDELGCMKGPRSSRPSAWESFLRLNRFPSTVAGAIFIWLSFERPWCPCEACWGLFSSFLESPCNRSVGSLAARADWRTA